MPTLVPQILTLLHYCGACVFPAGQVIWKAIQERFGPKTERCYTNLTEALADDPYFLTFHSTRSEKSVRMNIRQLLRDAAAAVQQQQQLGGVDGEGRPLKRQAFASNWGGSPTAAAAGDGSAPAVKEYSAAAAAAGKHLVNGQLLNFITRRTWHADMPQLDVARRALAVHLVQTANGAGQDSQVSTKHGAYVTTFPKAGRTYVRLRRRIQVDCVRSCKGPLQNVH